MTLIKNADGEACVLGLHISLKIARISNNLFTPDN